MFSYPCPETAGEYSTAARGIKPQWGFWLTESIQRNVESNVANVGNFNADNGPNVNDWNRDTGNDNVFAVPLVVSGKCDSNPASFAWRNESNRQASCRLPAKKLGAQCNFYLLMLGHPWQTLREFLEGPPLCWSAKVIRFYLLHSESPVTTQKYQALRFLAFGQECNA